MNADATLTTSVHEASRTHLRTTLASMELEIARLGAPGGEGASAQQRLAAQLAELAKTLDLGPEPALRGCPSCGKAGLRIATRCGHCWNRLEPLGA
jgi:hypothetical protein